MAADTETDNTQEDAAAANGSNGSDDHHGRRTLVRTAAVAAAAGAAALAARKVLADSEGETSGEAKESSRARPSGGGDDTLVGTMLVSGWRAAQDSLLPLAEDAAANAGEFVARNAPEIVSERLLPRFISGFERARDAGDGD